MTVLFLVALLLLDVLFIGVAVAMRTRVQEGKKAPVYWYYVQLPLAIGLPGLTLLEMLLRLIGFNLPTEFWVVGGWAIGYKPAKYIRKLKIDEQVPWKKWFGPAKLMRGTMLATSVEAAHIARTLYYRGKSLEAEDNRVFIVESTVKKDVQ